MHLLKKMKPWKIFYFLENNDHLQQKIQQQLFLYFKHLNSLNKWDNYLYQK